MASNLSVTNLLPKVRRTILQERANRDGVKNPTMAVGLSWLVWQVSGVHVTPGYVPRMDWNRYTSGGPKKYRGLVQRALSKLAKEGIMFERTRPECAVQYYEHGERDKYFQIRISQDEAKKLLRKML